MARSIVVAALGAIALGAGPADAQEPPALEAPIEAPADSPPKPPPAEKPRSAEPASSRPLLVIPGVTAPSANRTARKPAAEPAPPPLDSPTLDLEPGIPLRLETIPADGAGGPGVRASRTGPERHATSRPASPDARRSTSPFGRLVPSGTATGTRDSLTIESSGDPAVEAAVKRRVEKQVRDTLGDRVKDVDVRVSGRSVSIRARATRLWYRWSARRALESLAMPPGYRGKAVLID